MSELQEPCTPPKTLARTPTLPVADTPAIHKFMYSADPNLATEEHRKMALRDLREAVPLIPVDCFFGQGLLPDLQPGIDVDEIVAELVKKKVIYSSSGSLRWANFNSSKQLLKHEDEVFAVWPRIIKEIIDASVVDQSEATLVFECNPRGVMHSSTRDNKSKPDCVGRLSSASGDFGKRQWIEVAIPGEFKKDNNSDTLHDDTTKVIQSMLHIMREDPRRRFVFGFTIERWRMRLWLASRSDVLVSYDIDIHKHHHRVIEFFLRVIFAKPHQLGWDDTIRRLPSELQTPPRYGIDVNDKTYRTVRLLSNVGAEALRGRGTRVWEVRELSQNGEELDTPLVLKDSWVDSDRTREGKILENIRSAAKMVLNKDNAIILDTTLLHTHDYGDVQVCGENDDTHTVIRRGLDLSQHKTTMDIKANPMAHKKIISRMPPTGMALPPEKRQADQLQYSAKVHHCVVFKEIGIRTTEVESLAQVFVYLGEVVSGLGAMHACGWVHRDISIGNILVANGMEILADVEFAKSETATSQHSKRTGTFPFMAVEVEEGRYLYLTVSTVVAKERPQALLDARAAERAKKRLAKRGATPSTSGPSATAQPSKSAARPEMDWTSFVTQPFIYNPLHDLESVFWVCLWVILCCEFVKDDQTMTQEQWDGCIVAHGEFAADLFGDSKFRLGVMTASSRDFLAHATKFLPKVREIMAILDVFRRLLITRYREVEEKLDTQDYQIEFSIAAKGLHEDIIENFEEISSILTATSTSDLRVIIKEEDTIPVKLVKKKFRKNAANGTANTIVTATDAGGETSSRPAKSLKTPRNRFAALGSAPAFLPDIKRRTRSQTGSLPARVNGGTSGSGRR